jgi:hypothetical protein
MILAGDDGVWRGCVVVLVSLSNEHVRGLQRHGNVGNRETHDVRKATMCKV